MNEVSGKSARIDRIWRTLADAATISQERREEAGAVGTALLADGTMILVDEATPVLQIDGDKTFESVSEWEEPHQ